MSESRHERSPVTVHGGELGGEARLRRGQQGMARARLKVFMGDEEAAEPVARAALADFAGAMNWLDDTPEFEVAHHRLDEAGRWIRETFGCWITREGTTYSRTCPADLAHLRVGMSVGTKDVIRECNVCGQDPRSPTCRHIKTRTYPTTRRVVGGHCNLCGLADCGHVDGAPGDAICTHWSVRADLVEVSIVSRPAQPMARITKLGVPLDQLEATLGPRGWAPGMEVSCDKCQIGCRGVRECDHMLSPAANGM